MVDGAGRGKPDEKRVENRKIWRRKSCGGGGREGGSGSGSSRWPAAASGAGGEILSAGAKMTIDAIAQLQQHRNKLHTAPHGSVSWIRGPVEKGGEGKVEGGKGS